MTAAINAAKGRPVTRKSRQTGTTVTVGHADDLGLDPCWDEFDGRFYPWYTICDAHATCINHRSAALAERHAPVPAEWCEECRADLDRKAVEALQAEADRVAAAIQAVADRDRLMVEAIRDDARVGRGSCSVIDECFSDAELLALLDREGVRTEAAAVRFARRFDRADRAHYAEMTSAW